MIEVITQTIYTWPFSDIQTLFRMSQVFHLFVHLWAKHSVCRSYVITFMNIAVLDLYLKHNTSVTKMVHLVKLFQLVWLIQLINLIQFIQLVIPVHLFQLVVSIQLVKLVQFD